MKRIVTVTINPSVDMSARVEHVVIDDKLRCQQPSYEPGGGGINVSRAIRRLGGESVALYTSGGLYGQMLQHLLDEEGVCNETFTAQGCHHRCGECGKHLRLFIDDQRLGKGNRPY